MQITEDNFIDELQHHNEDALRYMIDQYGWVVKTVVYKRMAGYSSQLREECMNDTFLAIWQNCKSYDPSRSAFKTWMAAVTRYQILNCIRDNVPKQEALCTAAINEETGITHLETQLFDDEEEAFDAMLAVLSEQDREIFKMLFWEERDYREVSQAKHMSMARLYCHVFRGKKKMREQFEKSGKAGKV